MNRREFLSASVAGAVMLNQAASVAGGTDVGQTGPAGSTAAGNLEVAIDAARSGEPITPLIFGGYMEPATTRVWAEMLHDRKFAKPIVTSSTPERGYSFFRRFMGQPWRLVGPVETIEMDTVRPFVGQHSPRINVHGTQPRGIQQSGLHLGGGRSYVGRIYLAGDPEAHVMVRLAWGPGTSGSQVIPVPSLSREYRKFPLDFTPGADAEDARLEILGTGSGAFHIGTVSLMPADNNYGFHAGMLRLYREAGFKMAKWPGGNFVSAYDWYDGLGDRDKRPPRLQPMWSNRVESNDVGIDEFITFCRLLGAEPYVAVNSGFGEARVAAEEVEYCNGSTGTRLGRLRAENGHPEPYNVRLWCIGNEMYGWWQFGHMSLSQYWVKHNDFVEAMKRVDPGIKVTVCGASICEKSWDAAEQHQFSSPDIWRPPLLDKLPYNFGGIHDWDGWLLARCADNIDHLSEHTYAYPDFEFDAQKQQLLPADDPLQIRTRRMANRIGEAFDAWRKYVAKMPSLKKKNIKFIFDEWGTRYRARHGGFRRPQGMVTPLSYALFFHELFRHSDMVDASCPTGGFYTVLIDRTGEAVGFSVAGLVIKIMATHLAGALPVALSGNSPPQPVSGTPFVDIPLAPIGSPTYPLDVVAALSADRQTFILSVVNPSESSQNLTPRIKGARLRGPGRRWQIAAPDVNAANEPRQKPVVQIIESPQPTLPASILVPPISISVYEFSFDQG